MMRSTSIQTYRTIVEDGLLSAVRLRAYETLFEHGPLTGAELDSIATKHGNRGHYHKRLVELERLGVAQRLPARACRVTGRMAEEWDVTPHLPDPSGLKSFSRPPRRTIIKALEQLARFRDSFWFPDELEMTGRWLANLVDAPWNPAVPRPSADTRRQTSAKRIRKPTGQRNLF